MTRRVHLNRRAVEAVLKSAGARALVSRVAEEVADNVRAQQHRVEGVPGDIELPVKVDVYETDRARASVLLAHPSGIAVQAKHGALSKAAAQAGLEIEG